jgi:endonuclease YncB( thermonuclease family)
VALWDLSGLRRTIVIIAGISVIPALVSAEVNLVGKVISVEDGDTLTMVDDESNLHRIRIGGIDAPEKDQPYGGVSTAYLMELSNGKLATAECHKVDRYGRDVCTVRVNGVDVGLAQLKVGFAWHYKQYSSEQSPEQRQAYAKAEEAGRATAVGLWLQESPTPPWEWRHKKNSP